MVHYFLVLKTIFIHLKIGALTNLNLIYSL